VSPHRRRSLRWVAGWSVPRRLVKQMKRPRDTDGGGHGPTVPACRCMIRTDADTHAVDDAILHTPPLLRFAASASKCSAALLLGMWKRVCVWEPVLGCSVFLVCRVLSSHLTSTQLKSSSKHLFSHKSTTRRLSTIMGP
jgi:hypothetical protein